MPVSFWIFLGVCVLSFVQVIKDHGETWRNYKSTHQTSHLVKLVFFLWAIPVFTMIGTIVTGFESLASNKENASLHAEAGRANKLAAEANERSLILESNNLVLRTTLQKLESDVAPRITNIMDAANRLSTLKPQSALTYVIHQQPSSDWCRDVAGQVKKLLDLARWRVGGVSRGAAMEKIGIDNAIMTENPTDFPDKSLVMAINVEGVKIVANPQARALWGDTNQPSPMTAAKALAKELNRNGIYTFIQFISNRNPNLPERSIMVVVGARPPDCATKAEEAFKRLSGEEAKGAPAK